MENYNKLLEKAKEAYKNCVTGAEKRRLESIFPELKMSEDERIRKEIIEFLQLPHRQFVGERNQEEWIEWLQKQSEQNSTWSDDDEIGYNAALWAIKQARTIAKNENDMGDLWYAERWLKSLKPQPHWKPTDEQMQSLNFAIITYSKKDDYKLTYDSLNSLYNDLKKL